MLAELEELVYPLNRRIGALGKQQTFITALDSEGRGEIASPCSFLRKKRLMPAKEKIKVSVCPFEPLRRSNDPATTGERGTLNSSIRRPCQQILE